jgi:hypothetical protein
MLAERPGGDLFDTRAKGYLAKAADSLDKARQANDEDLKRLHETIAKQWHRLAEKGAANSASDKSASSIAVCSPNSENDPLSDTAPSTPRLSRVEAPLEWLLSCWVGDNVGPGKG